MKLIIITGIVFITACGKTDSQRTTASPTNHPIQTMEKIMAQEDSYLAVLEALNEGVAGAVSGSANVKIDKGEFIAYIRLFNSIPWLVHEQRYYEADTCPGLDHDLNGDGFLDIQEAQMHLGPAIIPLDYDLSSEEAQYDVYPSGDAAGSYWYEQDIPYETLLADLQAEDMTPDNDYQKFPRGRELNLNRGVILILGVPSWTLLPESVASTEGYANYQTLPIACGSLRKIYVVPGKPQSGDAPVAIPTGETGGPKGEYDDAPILPQVNLKT